MTKAAVQSSSAPAIAAFLLVAKKARFSPFVLLSLLFMLLFSFLYGEELAALIGQRDRPHSSDLDVNLSAGGHQQPAGKYQDRRIHSVASCVECGLIVQCVV
jgi:hypothetical protein